MENYSLKENRVGLFAALTVEPGIRIGLKSGNDQYIFDDIVGDHKVVKVGGWLAERCQTQIGLRPQKSNSADQTDIFIVFQNRSGGSSTKVKVSFTHQDGGDDVITKENVEKLTFSPKLLTIDFANEGTAHVDPPADDRQEDLRKVLQESQAREKELKERIRILDQTVQNLQGENEILRNNSAFAGQIGTEQLNLENLTRQLESANEQLQGLRSELAEKRKELADTSRGMEDTQKELADTEKQLNDTKTKMGEISSQKAAAESEHKRLSRELTQEQNALDRYRSENEVIQLDIEKTRKEIRSIQERLADDTLTAAAMEDDDTIGTGSVKNSLEKAESNLRSAEKKIEVIIKLREAINNRVQDAVVRKGTEFLSGRDEAGGQ